MDCDEFRQFGKYAVDYIANYLDTIREKQVVSGVEPGYLERGLPKVSPEHGENWEEIFSDLDKHIVPGLTHWHSPSFHAYMPTANSFAGIVGEMILSGIGGCTTTWESNPAAYELELKMMDWLVKMMGLPEHFLNSFDGLGGGSIQNSASESTLLAILTSKHRLSKTLGAESSDKKFVAYSSNQSNSSVEKAGLLASVPVRLLEPDSNGSLRGHTLQKAIDDDRKNGFYPCCVIATFGTTGICSFDDVEELADVCKKESLWLHVDAAYAGTALVCPEFRPLMKGIDKVDSFNFNPHKWMKVNSDCSALWFKDTTHVEDMNPKDNFKKLNPGKMPNIHLWQIPNSRRFRALKLWFVLRIHGVQGLQEHVRHQVGLASYFEDLVNNDERFEVCTSSLGVLTFRLKGSDDLTKALLERIQLQKKLFLTPYRHNGKLSIRFVVCSSFTQKRDMRNSWKIMQTQANLILQHRH
ncbi:aromatic-L-amino-acid decarboxylase-like [Coccinella septempunctata]|uniref:aromatic-L-amino-acid decarboxylase-like n=1 Tax=Coccinella septempunctata TaxID=41139 RepID=UPI001D08B9B2|nr:aromatic-L-amino-acid decarboxylase-like [Coccinella septempunctata]